MSHRMCDPRNKSALPRNGALGVLRRFCLDLAFVMAVAGLSKIETKLGLKEKYQIKFSARNDSSKNLHLMTGPMICIGR